MYVHINRSETDNIQSNAKDVTAVAGCVGHRANLGDFICTAEAPVHSLEVPPYPLSKNVKVSTGESIAISHH